MGSSRRSWRLSLFLFHYCVEPTAEARGDALAARAERAEAHGLRRRDGRRTRASDDASRDE